MKDDVTSDKMVLANGTILVSYHNGMASLRLKPMGKGKATVEEFLEELRGRLMYDERIEIEGAVINVYKSYGLV